MHILLPQRTGAHGRLEFGLPSFLEVLLDTSTVPGTQRVSSGPKPERLPVTQSHGLQLHLGYHSVPELEVTFCHWGSHEEHLDGLAHTGPAIGKTSKSNIKLDPSDSPTTLESP